MIIYCCTDLIFATKIGSTAKQLGVPSRPARDVNSMSQRLQDEEVSAVLIDLDLEDEAMRILRRVKERDRSIPVIAFGSHVATEILQAARAGGADLVMSRSQFTTQIPQLLQQFGKGDSETVTSAPSG